MPISMFSTVPQYMRLGSLVYGIQMVMILMYRLYQFDQYGIYRLETMVVVLIRMSYVLPKYVLGVF